MKNSQWLGVFHPKTDELYAVEETEAQATAIAIELAGKNRKPWPIRLVTIVDGELSTLLLDGAMRYFEQITKEYAAETAYVKEQIAEGVRNKQAVHLAVGANAERIRRRLEALKAFVDAITEVKA